jgi:hypothetical protein
MREHSRETKTIYILEYRFRIKLDNRLDNWTTPSRQPPFNRDNYDRQLSNVVQSSPAPSSGVEQATDRLAADFCASECHWRRLLT